MKNTKKSLIASGISLAVSVALLAGSTFAWFTDSVTNKGNKIEAGSLKIGAYAYDLNMGGTGESFTIEGVNGGETFTFEADGQNLKEDGTPIINETLWEPGKSSAKLLQVVNEGTLAAEIKLSFETSGELTNALWFDFVKVDNGKITGKFEKRPMSTLGTFAANVELPIINKGDTLQFILVYGMYEEAGNEYKDKDFTADVTILAKQYTYEEDGFGSSDYDEAATYPVATADNFKTALTDGGIISMGSDISIQPSGPDDDVLYPQVSITKDTTLDLNGKTLGVSVDSDESLKYTPAIISVNSGTLVINGNGTVNAEAGENNSYGITIEGGTVIINNGNYYGALTAVQVEYGHLEINGGFFDLAPTCKAQVPQYAKYVVNCIDKAYRLGTATIEIKGGTFVNFDPSDNPEGAGTSYVADGYKVISEEKDNGDIWYTVVPE